MNVILLLVIVGVALKGVLADAPANTSKIEKFILDRCSRYSTQASVYDSLKDHLEGFTDFMQLSFSHLPKDKLQFCEADRPQLVQSMKVIERDLKHCVPTEEKYLPSFLYESLVEFLKFLCDHNGRNIDNYFSTLTRNCREKLESQQAGNEVGDCFKKLLAPFKGKGIVKKDDLCFDLTQAHKCLGTTITKHCPDFPSFERLNTQFFKAIRKPCNAASTINVGTLILLIGVYFTKLIS